MKNLKNLIERGISGAIFVALVVLAILWSPYSFFVLFAIAVSFGLYEFHNITNNKNDITVNKFFPIIGGLILFTISFLNAKGSIGSEYLAIYMLYAIAVFISELFLKRKNPINNISYFAMGQIYVAFPFAILSYILYISGTIVPILLLAMFITLWVNDTGAYISGMTLGKHKLFERVSPKKTWEGFFGGAIFSILAAYIFSLYIPQLTFVQWVIYVELVVIFGTLGDLVESLLKRTVGVKDAGTLIPGHGGLLDRFDSMLLISPIIWLYLSFIYKIV